MGERGYFRNYFNIIGIGKIDNTSYIILFQDKTIPCILVPGISGLAMNTLQFTGAGVFHILGKLDPSGIYLGMSVKPHAVNFNNHFIEFVQSHEIP